MCENFKIRTAVHPKRMNMDYFTDTQTVIHVFTINFIVLLIDGNTVFLKMCVRCAYITNIMCAIC